MADQKIEAEKAYLPQEEGTFFDDGREIELQHFVYGKPDIDAIRGSPQRVLAAIDEFGRTRKYLMNVGEDKGKIVTDLIKEVKPKTMLYLIRVHNAGRLPADTNPRYYTLERNPEFGAVVASLVDLAGLSATVKVIIGSSDASLKRLHAVGELQAKGAREGKEAGGPGIDMLFLDHYKPAYTTDLKLCEELGLVGVGTVPCADNVIAPGNPPYLDYVRSSVRQKREEAVKVEQASSAVAVAAGENGHVGVDERFAARNANQYAKSVHVEKLDMRRIGNPNLVYESRLVESWEPTGETDGIEVTRCVGEDTP